MLAPPSRLANYELGEELGRGGSGIVYSARDMKADGPAGVVAVKVLFSAGADGRPLREIRAAALLDHPGIARIYDAGEDAGHRFVAMELVPGSPLDRILKKGALTLERAVDYSSQILSALEAAHSAGVIHRDLKPSNLMVTPDGRIKVVDFGLAKVVSPLVTGPADVTSSQHWTQFTREGALTGTIAYMSPEQAEGKPVDGRSDIFSFGAVLYEMLTGRMAFGRESQVATLVAVMSQEPDPAAGIPPAVRPVLNRCLRKNPDERWHSVSDLKFALQLAASPAQDLDRAAKTQSRRDVLLWAGGAAAVTGAAAFLLGRRSSPKVVPTFEQVTFTSGELITARLSSDGLAAYLTFRMPGNESFQIYETHFGTRTMRPLGLPPGYVQGVSPSGELVFILLSGNADVLARAFLDGAPVKALANGTHYATWGPDGKTLMAGRILGSKGRIEYPLGTVIAEGDVTRGDPFQFAILSRDGRKIAFFRPDPSSRTYQLCVVDAVSGAPPARVLSSGWTLNSPIHWSPGNEEIWFSAAKAGQHTGLWACGMDGRERCLLEAPGQITLQDVRQFDGAALLVSHDSKTSIHVSSAGQTEETEYGGVRLNFISDDGGTLMASEPIPGAESSHSIFVYTKGNRNPLRIGECNRATLSPDGTLVAFDTSGPTGQRLLVAPVGPGEVRDVSRPEILCQNMAWFGDGDRLMVAGRYPGKDAQTFVLSLKDRSFIPVTAPGTWGELVSRDGKSLLTCNGQGQRMVLDLESGTFRDLGTRDSTGVPLCWHADGKSIFFTDVPSGYTEVGINRVDVKTRRSVRFRTIKTNRGQIDWVVMTPDGQHVGYVLEETNSTLYLVHGLPGR